jgi:Mg-chelatase subunit ChlD
VVLDVAVDDAAALGPVQLFSDVALPTADFAELDAVAESAMDASGFAGMALGGTGEDDGATALASTEFFGIGGYGQSFVYVVDASDSMNERGKFDRARYELMQSIEQLASDQRYFVIFFNDGPHPMEGESLVEATPEQVSRTARWVSGARASGGTNPLPALLHAISLRPDAVYFLSDGQFDPATITQLRWRNRANRRLGTREVPIHSIAFVDRITERQMRTIARNSGGDYRFVE